MKAKYAWIITKDSASEFRAPQEADIYGPSNAGFTKAEVAESGEPFRMFDDDANLVYEGMIRGDYSGFEPLDDFGRPNAGCTYIMYGKEKDGKMEWKIL